MCVVTYFSQRNATFWLHFQYAHYYMPAQRHDEEKKRLSPVYWSAAAAALHRCNYAWDVGGAVQRAAMNLSVMMREHSRDSIKQQVQCTLNFHSLCFSDWNKAKEVNRANIRIVSNHLVIHACELFQDICDKPVSKPTLPCLWLEHFI